MLWLDKPQATLVMFYQASLRRKRCVHGYLHWPKYTHETADTAKSADRDGWFFCVIRVISYFI